MYDVEPSCKLLKDLLDDLCYGYNPKLSCLLWIKNADILVMLVFSD